MGGCSANHVDEVEAGQFSRDQFTSMINKETTIPRGFDDAKLVQTPLPKDVLEQFETSRKSFNEQHGRLERLPHIDAKFPHMSPSMGPLTNAGGTLVYLGSVKDGFPHGWGEAATIEGLFYEGYFEEGVPNYYGRIKTSDGSLYEGGLYRFLKDGYGKLTLSNGVIQEGEWKFGRLFCSSRPHRSKLPFAAALETDAVFPTVDSRLRYSCKPIGDFSPPPGSFNLTPFEQQQPNKSLRQAPEDAARESLDKPPARSCFKKLTAERKPSDRHISFAFPDLNRN